MRKIKQSFVTLAHHHHDDFYGGSYRIAAELAHEIFSRGFRSLYICCEPPNAKQIFTKSDLIARYPYPSGMPSFLRAFAHIRRTRNLVYSTLGTKTDTRLLAHSPLQCFAASKFVRSGVKLDYVVHSPMVEEMIADVNSVGFMHIIQKCFSRFLERTNLRRATRIHVLSEYAKRLLYSYLPKSEIDQKTVVTPGWVDCDKFSPSTKLEQREIRQEWGIADGSPVFLTVRRLEQRMGLDTLVAAVAALPSELSRAVFLIGGEGSQRKNLEARIEELNLKSRVRLTGRLTDEKLVDVFKLADCYLLPSRSMECFGLTSLEAFACGLPVISSDCGANPEVAGLQGEDWLFEAGDEFGLSRKISDFMSGRLLAAHDPRNLAKQFDRSVVYEKWLSRLGAN